MMKRQVNALILLSILFTCSITGFGNVIPVNSIIGDQSFKAITGKLPTANSNENLRVKYHLIYVCHLLAKKDVSSLSAEKKRKRFKIIKALLEYVKINRFPKNYEFKTDRKPCFIDRENTICAVGYLIQETEGRAAAELINETFQYAEVYEMDTPTIERWAFENGLTLEECAMIQPSYEWVPFKQRTVAFSLGNSYRFSEDIYTKFDLSYSTQYIYTKKIPSILHLELTVFNTFGKSLAIGYRKSFLFRNHFSAVAGIGGEYFSINQDKGWNLVPEAGVIYQFIKGRMNVNGLLTYGYHIGLSNRLGYSVGRNDVTGTIGLGYRL